jgi:acyl-CoA thioester hydrolase
MGHVNNAGVHHLSRGRAAGVLASIRLVPDYRRVPFILAQVTCDFRSEALVSEVLELAIRCEWIGTKSFGFVYEIREATSRRVVVEASTVQVCYDYAAKRSIPMPDSLRTQLEAFEGRALTREVKA